MKPTDADPFDGSPNTHIDDVDVDVSVALNQPDDQQPTKDPSEPDDKGDGARDMEPLKFDPDWEWSEDDPDRW